MDKYMNQLSLFDMELNEIKEENWRAYMRANRYRNDVKRVKSKSKRTKNEKA